MTEAKSAREAVARKYFSMTHACDWDWLPDAHADCYMRADEILAAIEQSGEYVKLCVADGLANVVVESYEAICRDYVKIEDLLSEAALNEAITMRYDGSSMYSAIQAAINVAKKRG